MTIRLIPISLMVEFLAEGGPYEARPRSRVGDIVVVRIWCAATTVTLVAAETWLRSMVVTSRSTVRRHSFRAFLAGLSHDIEVDRKFVFHFNGATGDTDGSHTKIRLFQYH